MIHVPIISSSSSSSSSFTLLSTPYIEVYPVCACRNIIYDDDKGSRKKVVRIRVSKPYYCVFSMQRINSFLPLSPLHKKAFTTPLPWHKKLVSC